MYDVIIVGCGVVGSSLAFYLSRYDLSVLILEKENDVSMGTTRANSAIIHAGYDPAPKTLKAKLNVEGSRLIKDLAKDLGVCYIQNGSLVLAFSKEDEKTLEKLYENGVKNGVEGIRLLDKKETLSLEKNVNPDVLSSLYAPTGAIINPWDFCLALTEVAVKNGVYLRLSHTVENIEKIDGGYKIITNKGDFEGEYIINCAGVYADTIHNTVANTTFEIIPTKGQYYLLDKSEGKTVFHTVFQCPSKNGKGVLVTPTVHGNLLVGPDAKICEKDDTTTDFEGLSEIKKAALLSVPTVNFRASIRNFAGVRANSSSDDFIIDFAEKNFLDVAGIRSPGLSSAPAIALYSIEKLKESGLLLKEKENYAKTREKTVFKNLSEDEKNELIKKEPSYGRVICRCETITEGEILSTFSSPVPPTTVDGVKRRVLAGMGRCQGGFCSPRVVEILSKKLGKDMADVQKDKDGSYILVKEEN